MPEEKLAELRNAIALSASAESATGAPAYADVQSHDSIGILNVNSRMVLYYGAGYTLLIDSEKDVGTNVQIRIPYQTMERRE